MKRLLGVLAVLASSVACDQATKELAVRELKGEPPIETLGGAARLVYAENPGAFLGLGRDWPDELRVVLFIGLAAVAAGVAVWVLWRRRPTRLMQIGIALFAGGALGNLVDRVLRDGGRVVDFMQLGVAPLQTGVFNVADVLLMAALPFFLFARQRPPTADSDAVA